MEILKKVDSHSFPLTWVNLDYMPESNGYKAEISLVERESMIEGLVQMFISLFRSTKDSIKIYNSSWWDFCLDTWNPINDRYDYEPEGKSNESKAYLQMLKNSGIQLGFSGTCHCENWDAFLTVILPCIITNQAPYSPIFYSVENDFFFYFHHTGSIGFYFTTKGDLVTEILSAAKEKYDVKYY